MASCSTCAADLIQGSMFCDTCGATVSKVKVARKLRQASFDTVKDTQGGLLAVGERLKSRWQTYIIEESIARSGFGATFRALRKRDGKQVLIKQMMDQAGYDQFKSQLMKSFKREAKFLKKTKHPIFPRGFEYFLKNKSFFLVMEFINGKELAKAMDLYREKSGDVPNGVIVYLGIEIAEAIEVIHRAGYIYRDLKPQNVMLDGITGRVKLIDFGTLYHRSDSDPLLFESEGYTPPEFMVGDNDFTPAGDVFSLGAMLYEIATGETPEPGAKLDSDHDRRLRSIINRCIEADPKDRYQRASQVKKELSKLTRRGFLFFRFANRIKPVSVEVLPKSLFPPACTFCQYCGYADPSSDIGYCETCRTPLQVGRLTWRRSKRDKHMKEFFLYSDETVIGSASDCAVSLNDMPGADKVASKQCRIFRREKSLWIEATDTSVDTRLNGRRILGPVELQEGDRIELAEGVTLIFGIEDAC